MSERGSAVRDVHVALIGAGRLGQAIGRSFERVWCRPLPVWSRRFSGTAAAGGGAASGVANDAYCGLEIVSLQRTVAHAVLLSAIPNSALLGLARSHAETWRNFSGLLLLAGADAPLESLVTLIPNGKFARVVPVILPGRSEFVFFAHKPDGADAAWDEGFAFLNALGSVLTVPDSEAYEELMILTSPLATVIRAALSGAIAEFLDSRRANPAWQKLAESVTALSLSGCDFPIGQFDGGRGPIATPGGITEAGLSESRVLTQGFVAVMRAMRKRADALQPALSDAS